MGSSNLLGIAVGDREFACAQLSGGGGKRSRVRGAARWEVPASLSLENPEAMGEGLRRFLDANGLTARRAVIGLPARWLIAEPRELPPTDREQALASLRLQAERLGAGEGDAGLVFDAAGTFGNGRAGQALLVGVSRQRLDWISRLCAAAGIVPIGVTATGLVVGEALDETAAGGAECPTVLFSGQGAEVVWHTRVGPRALRHLVGTGAGTSPGAGALGAELSRALSIAGGGGAGSAGAGGRSCVVMLGAPALSEEERGALVSRLGREVRSADVLESLGRLPALAALNGDAGRVAGERLWPAVALAGRGAGGGGELPVNFLKPALAPPRVSRYDRRLVLGIVAALLVVVALGSLWYEAVRVEADAQQVVRILEERRPEIERARKRVDRFNYGRGYYETRPPILDCLRELSGAFGPEDPVWATGFTLRADGRGTLQGRATDQRAVLALRDKLMSNPRLTNVQLQNLSEAAARSGGGEANRGGGRGGSSRTETSFALNFTYVGGGPQP